MPTHHVKLRQLFRSARFYLATLLAVTAISWLTSQYNMRLDWTATEKYTLSDVSKTLLARMNTPIEIKVYLRDGSEQKAPIEAALKNYTDFKPTIKVTYLDPEAVPDQAKKDAVTASPELVISYNGRREHATEVTEVDISSALQRLMRARGHWVAFTSGHGERSPYEQAPADMLTFGDELDRRGYNVQALNLAATNTIPDNVSVLIVASPQTRFLPGEAMLIREFLTRGGNLLWLMEPGVDLNGLEPIAERLGIETLPGTVVSMQSQSLGVKEHTFALVTDYPSHPALRGVVANTVFPSAVALEAANVGPWVNTVLLNSNDDSWNETGDVVNNPTQDAEADEQKGPLTLGLAFTNTSKDSAAPEAIEQRAAIIGDGDFLSNRYIGNGGNFMLGIGLVEWLAHEDGFIDLAKPGAPDSALDLSSSQFIAITVLSLIITPTMLFGIGIYIWRQRKNK